MRSKQKFTRLLIYNKKKSLRNAHSNALFYRHKIIKLHDKIIIAKYLFIGKSISFDLPSIINNWFTFSSGFRRYETSCSSKGFFVANTKRYGREALISSAMSSCNDVQEYFSSNEMPCDVSTFKLQSLLAKHFLEI